MGGTSKVSELFFTLPDTCSVQTLHCQNSKRRWKKMLWLAVMRITKPMIEPEIAKNLWLLLAILICCLPILEVLHGCPLWYFWVIYSLTTLLNEQTTPIEDLYNTMSIWSFVISVRSYYTFDSKLIEFSVATHDFI